MYKCRNRRVIVFTAGRGIFGLLDRVVGVISCITGYKYNG
jgi:hypothetical protein